MHKHTYAHVQVNEEPITDLDLVVGDPLGGLAHEEGVVYLWMCLCMYIHA